MKISVMTDILEANDRIASVNREIFYKHGKPGDQPHEFPGGMEITPDKRIDAESAPRHRNYGWNRAPGERYLC